MVDLLMLPFLCLLESMCKTWVYFWFVAGLMLKFALWLIIVPAWDVLMLAIWMICKIFKLGTPKLTWGKYLTLKLK